MFAGDTVVMNHPDGYATITGSGGRFVGWIPNGVAGTIYLVNADARRAVVNFEGKLMATVELSHLRPVALEQAVVVPSA